MSTEIESSEQKIDLSKLGQFYSPIDFFDYGPSNKTPVINGLTPAEPKKSDISCSPNLIDNKTKLKVKFKNICTKVNKSFAKKNNKSYNMSRNDNNINEITTTISTLDDKNGITNVNSSMDEKSKITKLKELLMCSLCNGKIIQPKICPNCFRIACEQCVKKWFINYKNKKCFFCKNELTLEKMINIPVINNISNILNKKTIDIKNDSLVLKQLTSRLNKANKNNYNHESNRNNISSTTTRKFIQNTNNLNIRKCLKKIKHRKFPNSISESRKTNMQKNQSINYEHCPIHQDQYLFYYCINCEKSYCRTCFVFFGEEKNKHIGHTIIDYDKFQDKNNFELFRQIKYLKENNDKIKEFINKCENLKNCYNVEKIMVNKYMQSIINNYNNKIEENIKKLNELIVNYKKSIEQINKERINIKQYYLSKNNTNFTYTNFNILNEIKKMNNLEYSKEIDNYANLSPKFLFNVYHTDLKRFDILDNNFRFKAKLNNSKYNLVVLRKEKEVQVYIYYPIEKDVANKKLIFPYIYFKKKDNKWEIYELKESLVYNGHNYFIKRFNPETFCEKNSYFNIKGILYENFFM